MIKQTTFAIEDNDEKITFDVTPSSLGRADVRVRIFTKCCVKVLKKSFYPGPLPNHRQELLKRDTWTWMEVFERYIQANDRLLVTSAITCDSCIAESIMTRFFCEQILNPSIDDEKHWFREFAPGLWEFHSNPILKKRERMVEEVMES